MVRADVRYGANHSPAATAGWVIAGSLARGATLNRTLSGRSQTGMDCRARADLPSGSQLIVAHAARNTGYTCAAVQLGTTVCALAVLAVQSALDLGTGDAGRPKACSRQDA